jgi:predicted phosphodiesterase
MKPIVCDLPRNHKQIEIHPMADLHIGDRFCDMNLIQKRLEHIKETPSAYIILNGDIINNATKTSVSDCYAEELTPMEQISRFVELFEPVKDKILAVTGGNHEARTYNKEGIDITALAAKQIGIYDRYSKTSALLFIRFGEQTCGMKESNGSGKVRRMCYTMYTTHGTGGGRKEGAKAIRLADMACIVDADIYLHSHTHLPMIMKEAFYRTDIRNNAVAMVNKLFVNTAAALDYGGYGEAYEFKPASKDTPIIYLSGTRKEMTARL